MGIRTDLAAEAHSLWWQSAGKTTKLSGVIARQEEENGIALETVEITSAEGAKALGKPVGRYLTLNLPEDGRANEAFTALLAKKLSMLLQWKDTDSVLVVGLGNRAMTPDAIGPMTADGVLVTRHLRQSLPQFFAGMRSVSALRPGVLGMTGVESAEVVRSVVERIQPDRVIVVDALAAGSPARLCRSVQLTDVGIVPGSGVGNSRAAFSPESPGVPVVAVGVPTVVDAAEKGQAPLLVTPRDIDVQARRLSRAIFTGINGALFPGWSAEEIAQFVE